MSASFLRELPIIKDDVLLEQIFESAKKYSPQVYIISQFLTYTGIRLVELIKLKKSAVQGTSYVFTKNKRIFIYGTTFKQFINNYIENECADSEFLFPIVTDNSKHLCQTVASQMVIDFFRDCGYKASASTFTKTFFYLFAKNYGSLNAITDKAYESRWVESTLGMSFNDYKNLKNSSVPLNIYHTCVDYLDCYINEVSSRLTDKNTSEEERALINEQLYELYKCVYKAAGISK